MGNSSSGLKRKQHFFVVPGLIGSVTFVFFWFLIIILLLYIV